MSNENTRNKLSQKVKDNNVESKPKAQSNAGKSNLQAKVNDKSNEKPVVKKTTSSNDSKPNKKKEKKEHKYFKFFYKLSIIGRIMLVIYAIILVVFIFLVGNYALKKGSPIMGERQAPTAIISSDTTNKIKDRITKEIAPESVSVELRAYRLVIVMDLADDANIKAAKKANEQAMNILNDIVPIDQFFSSEDKLNNDFAIYSADKVSTDDDKVAKYIYLTYKNSKMAKAESYDLTQPRDEESFKQVEALIKQGAE